MRQGFERFKIADLDNYELKNFNRQYGARIDTINKSKVDVIKEEALKINPNCQIEIFPEGISESNIDTFLKDVDLSVSGIDAFAVYIRQMFVNKSLAANIPVLDVGPIGLGTAFLIFMPGGPNFDKFFAVTKTTPYEEKLFSFFIGLVPKMLQRSYMKRVNLKEKRGPSSIGSVNLCAGIVTIYALKILLKKGSVRAVPYYHQFDVMKEKYVTKKLWFGNKNPLQKLKIKFAKLLIRD